ncbi:MAG TPA: metalloregulator ArsR/SmtB family transcription factor [Myxococcales bacterium LLY-WYZ-16_1]|jgi:ArsR family transcriptional regulator|nr:metalloregulator ArsR/SmtB family transcription factor [Myxococcales bacterium LLY-WYZ-16_1]
MPRRPAAKPMPPGGFDAVASRFRCLADSTRLRVLYELSQGPKTVSELTERVGITQPNTSRHLQTLLREGLVSRERQGSHVSYAIRDPSVYQLCELVCGSIQRRLDDERRAWVG